MEKIYTIPVNEAFDASAADKSCGCPFCALYNGLEKKETDAILGAAMMEPDIRIETNKKGFCRTHYDLMFGYKNRLGLALIFQRVADVVQLVGVVAVVVEHIVQQRQHFLRAHRLVAGVRVAVMCMIVIVFMFVHGEHSFLSGAGPLCGKNTLL